MRFRWLFTAAGLTPLRVLCVSVVSLSVVISAVSYYFVQPWLADRARYDEWAATERIERQLDRTVEMKFATEPSYDQWLAEWSRQTGVSVVHESHSGAESYALQLQPMTAREALQTFCRTYECDWRVTEAGVRVSRFPFDVVLETRTYPLPVRDSNNAEWRSLAARLLDAPFDPRLVERSPGALQITAHHHHQVCLANYFARLATAIDQTHALGPFDSGDPAWQPQYLESDPAAMVKALSLLEQPVTLDAREMPLNEVARELARQLDYPVLVDPHLELRQWIQVDSPVTCQVRNLPLGQLRLRANTYSIHVVPAVSGHALLLVVDPFEREHERKFVVAYPVPDLLEARPAEGIDSLMRLIGGLADRRGFDYHAIFDKVLVLQDVTIHQQRMQALLAAIRDARTCAHGLTSRTQLLPKTPASLAVLDEPAELVYLDVPLEKVVADVQQRFGLVIETEVFSREVTNIWCHLPAQTLRDNLERMLAPYELSLVVDGPRVQILTQYEAVQLADADSFEYEAYNIGHLAPWRKNRGEEVANLLLGLADDLDFRFSGGDGVLVPFQELLVARQRPATLDRVRQVFLAMEAQALRTPRQVQTDALANRSAPFFVDTGLWETPAEAVLRKELQAKLDRPITISLEQEEALNALLSIARQYQLPIVHPGYQHAEVDTKREMTFTARDEALADVLARFLPPDNTKQWLVGRDGTLQTWYPEFLPGGEGRAARWLFDVSDLLQPAGPLLPGQLHRMLYASLPNAAGFGLGRQKLHLGRFLEVSTKLQRDWFQHTLHELRTGKLPPVPPVRGDEQENSEQRFVPPIAVEVPE